MTGGTIVCGVAGSPDDQSAVDFAHALGSRLGLRLVLVHVVKPPSYFERNHVSFAPR